MRTFRGIWIALMATALSVLQAHATHIMGGELNYVRITSDSFRISLSYYVDCVNGNPGAINEDKFAIFGFFNANTNQFITTESIERSAPVLVTEINYECISNKPNACVHKYQYVFDKKIDPGDDGLIISFQRCCRNRTINNIYDPEATGMTLMAFIPPNSVANSNPVFKQLPPNFLCNDAPLIFDHSATDLDGDSLVYELYNPLLGANQNTPRPTKPSNPPYNNVIFVPPYNVANMMGGTKNLKIHRNTGLLTVTPEQTGQFVVGIKVSEYRNGVKIGETLRDYQFNVLPCQLTIKANFKIPDITCKTRAVLFENTSDSAKNFIWDFGVEGSDDTSNQTSPVYTYSEKGTYTITLIAQNKNCKDTVQKSIEIGHLDSINATIAVFPDTVCLGQKIRMRNESQPTSDFWWMFDDGQNDVHNTKEVNHLYGTSGRHKIVLKLIDSTKCNVEDTALKYVVVIENRQIQPRFGLEYLEICSPQKAIFTKLPDTLQTWSWELPETPSNLDNKPSFEYTFNHSGSTRIKLWSTDSVGRCITVKTFDTTILVPPANDPYNDLIIPNIFTPNGDGINDCYQMGGSLAECVEVRFEIYNRWGEKIFDSELDGNCWDGNKVGSERPYSDGTYFGIVREFDKAGNEIHRISNTITLIR